MWNRVEGEKGFDADAVLPYRERLIVIYSVPAISQTCGVAEAYVHDGEWYWWDGTTNAVAMKIPSTHEIKAWTIFPHELVKNE
jgi:hypothetical protein